MSYASLSNAVKSAVRGRILQKELDGMDISESHKLLLSLIEEDAEKTHGHNA